MNARAVALGLAVTLAARGAIADRAHAAAAYKQGAADFARGAFVEAATEFETAFAEDPRAASIYNAALAWQSAHSDARAADDFARALAAGDLRADLLENANAQLAKLETTLGRLSITGPVSARFSVTGAGNTVVASVAGSPPSVIHLSPGRYVVVATDEGGATREFPVDVAAGASGNVDLTRGPVSTSVKPTLPAPEAEVSQQTGVLGRTTLPVAMGLIGAGLVASGFSIGFGLEAKSALNQFTQSGDTSQSLHDRAVSNRDASNVLLVSGLVVGGAGIAALVTVHRVQLRAAVGPRSIQLVGAF